MGQAEKDANNWKKMVDYRVVGGLLTSIPMAGDAVQRTVDRGLSASLNDDNAKVDAATSAPGR